MASIVNKKWLSQKVIIEKREDKIRRINTIAGINRILNPEESSRLFWCGVVFVVIIRVAPVQGRKF